MMKALAAMALAATPAGAFLTRSSGVRFSPSILRAEGKLQKIEQLKVDSNSLREPLKTEMQNDEIFVTHDGYQILKYHGSYMQDNRELRKKGQEKAYSFMLRLKMPCGEVPTKLHQTLDDLCDKYGQHDLRATTRQAYQMHGVMKGDLKTVISTLMEMGSSTVGACGDVSRNVMCTPAPKVSKPYAYAREYSKVMAELLKPQSTAFTELWLGDEKVAEVEYWRKDIDDAKVQADAKFDNGRGIILSDPVEPLYGKQYLPRKFKVAVTVPGDNSLDIYINDIGLVVITDPATEELLGFNVMVGGGMGRTHNKESTFARAADHLGFVAAADVTELCKAILATQRDHGNREVRANARMKYLVHTMGIDAFRTLVESYFGKPLAPWRPMAEWKYQDWMGWHEQGDGKLFLGLNVEQGRIRDVGEVKIKTLLRHLADKFGLSFILTPSQSVIIRDVNPSMKAELEAVIRAHGVKLVEDIDPLTRLSIACPALPMCGLAITEAERVMPAFVVRTRALLDKHGLDDSLMMRMTGCPNGCARPYMSELAFVGDGPSSYQIWVGGSPVLEARTNFLYKDRVPADSWEKELEPLLAFFKEARTAGEAFGDFCARVGVAELQTYAAAHPA
jgi:sulfite reductase (ferredoxin)